MAEEVQHITLGRKVLRISLKVLLWIFGIFMLLFLSVWAVLKVPKVQNFVVHRVTHYVSDKTNTRVELGEIDLGFPKYLILKNLFLEDLKHDTLAYAQKISIDIDMMALLQKKISIDELELDHVHINLQKSKRTQQFNYQFLVDAFASKDKDTLAIKDTSGTKWAIDANKFELLHSTLNFEDSVSGLFLNSGFQKVSVDLDGLDLDKKSVTIDDVLLSGIQITLLKSMPSAPDTSTGGGWDKIVLNDLKIENTVFEYKDTHLKTRYYANISKSSLEDAKVSLLSQTISLDQFFLGQSTAEILLFKDTIVAAPKQGIATPKTDQGWTVSAGEILLENNNFALDNQLAKLERGIDYNHLLLSGVTVAVEDVYYQGDKIQAQVNNLKAQERSGLGIRSFEGNLAMDKNFMKLTDFELNTNLSHIERSITVYYPSLAELQTKGNLNVNMPKSRIAIQEILWLVPSLEKTEIIAKNKSRTINFEVNALGSLRDLNVKKLTLQAADTTFLSMEGKLQNLTDPKKMSMDLIFHEVVSSAKDLKDMLPATMLPASIALPAQISLKGTHKGTLNDFATQLELISSIGNAQVSASIADLNGTMPQYDILLKTPGFALGHLLKQNTIGSVAGNVKVKGSGFDKNTAVADLNAEIQKIGLQNYTYRNIKADAQINSGIASLKASVQDTNLALKVGGTVGFIPSKEYYKIDVNLLGADLYRLGLYSKQLQVSAHLTTDIQGSNAQNINGSANIRNIVIVRDNKEYKIDSLMVASVNQPNKNSTTVTSTLLTAQFNGNIDLLSVAPAITVHLNKYFAFQEVEKPTSGKSKKNTSKLESQNFDFVFKLNESPIIKEVFLPELSDYKSISITGSFNSDSSRLRMNLDLPTATYGTNKIQNLTFAFDSDKEKASYNMQVGSLNAGDVKLFKTMLSGDMVGNKIGVNLIVEDSSAVNKLNLKSQLTKAGSNFRYTILPDGLSIQQKSWEVNPNNFIEFGKKYLRIEQFQISQQGQSLAVQSSADLKDIRANIHKFDLRTISQIIEKNDSIVRGTLDGQIDLQQFQKDLRFTSNLNLTDLTYKSSKVGDVSVKADNHTAQRYTIHADVTGMGNDIDFSGYYNPVDKTKALNFTLDIKTLKLASFDSFSNKQISESSGGLTGKLEINGSAESPEITGILKFVEAKTKVAFINERLYMKEEVISFSQKGITFESFVIRDEAGNTAKIQGDVRMKAFKDIQFDLNVSTRNFMVLNTTAIQNKNYYGRIILDSDIKVQGTPDLPKVNAVINLAKGSKFTVAVPESKVSVDRGEGVVLFLYDPNDLHPIMLRREDLEDKASALKGIDLDAKIKLHSHTPLKILIDPYTGDSLVVNGRADLNFSMDPSGKMSLSGIYTVSGGSYKAYIEGVLPKSFDLVKGGRIIWNGDPLDAQVDLSAKYNVRTSPAELMTLGGGGSVSDSSELSRPFVFEVYLVMQGELLKPKISFRLDMPENQRYAGGGAIYGKVAELNTNENELNKQVFSLLVLNKFLPASQTNTGGGGMTGFARSSVSRLMSDQLNQLSGQYLKGVELNFDVQSYNFNQGGKEQANTMVNVGLKKDFNRLSVQVGSNVAVEGNQQNNAQNLTGDVQVGYKLTKDGRYKLKAFRQNQVDNVANGIVTETGAGVLYSRNYNKTRELFNFLRRKKKKN